jgi:hypothetical protein
MARAQFDQVAAAGQALERGFELLALAAAGAGLLDELFEVGAGVRQLRDVVQQCPIRHDPILLSTFGGVGASESLR